MSNSEKQRLDLQHLSELRRMAFLYHRHGFFDKAEECLALARQIEERLAGARESSLADSVSDVGR